MHGGLRSLFPHGRGQPQPDGTPHVHHHEHRHDQERDPTTEQRRHRRVEPEPAKTGKLRADKTRGHVDFKHSWALDSHADAQGGAQAMDSSTHDDQKRGDDIGD